MSHAPSEGSSCEPNLIPLLDLVLQLIMFFMITVNFVNTDHINAEILLPEAQTAVPLDQPDEKLIFMNLNKDGQLVGTLSHLKTRQRVLEFLRDEKEFEDRKAKQAGKKEGRLTVVVRAHKEARYRDVWSLLHTCTEAGIKKWQLRLIKVSGGPA